MPRGRVKVGRREEEVGQVPVRESTSKLTSKRVRSKETINFEVLNNNFIIVVILLSF